MRSDGMLAPVILVTGSRGQVGFELRRSMALAGRVTAVDRTGCDLSDPAAIRELIRTVRPDVIVNAAAYTAVDRAEDDAAQAYAINGTAPGVLAEEARKLGSLMVHYSTDYVFDGEKVGAYVETDAVAPVSVYGSSKLAGEEAVLASGARAVILRTSWVAGAHGQNFCKTILRLAQERDTLRVVTDQAGAPTTASLIADVTAAIVRRHAGGANGFPYGVYHLAAAGETTWHGYAVEVLRYAAARGLTFKITAEQVEPIPAAAYPLPARRPVNSRLDTTRLRETFGFYLPDWRDGVHYLLDQLIL